MKDIEKLKREYEQKLRYAELENRYNESLEKEGIQLSIIGESCMTKGKLHVVFHTVDYNGELNTQQAQTILNEFPSTEDCETYVGKSQYDRLPYVLETHRGPHDAKTSLSFRWIYEDMDCSFDMDIDETDPNVMQFFTTRNRALTQSEISAYGIQKTRFNVNYRNFFPYLSFNCGHVVRFEGGHDKQIASGIITSVVETIKWETFND